MAMQDFNHTSHIYNTGAGNKIVPIIIELFHPASVIDVGCGNGSWLNVFLANGVEDVLGVDGPYVKKENLLISPENFSAANLEEPLRLSRRFDLAICLEVAEHLGPDHADTLIQSLVDLSDNIVFSGAIPGQGGEQHLNEQPPQFWQQLFQQKGFHTYDVIRPKIWDDKEIFWWYRQNVFIATKVAMFPGRDENIPHLVHPELLELTQTYFADRVASINQINHSPTYLWKKLLQSLNMKIR
jgi:SAM-dependent methyltransferase